MMNSTPLSDRLIPWDTLSAERQWALRKEYRHYLDRLPPICSFGTMLERFRRWLEYRGVEYRGWPPQLVKNL